MDKTCPRCMRVVPGPAKVCPHCRADVTDPVDTLGADVVRSVNELFTPGPGSPATGRADAPTGSGRTTVGGLIIFGVFLLGGVLALTFVVSMIGADQGWWQGNLLDWLGLSAKSQ
jgi:hypothetical protein